MADEVVYEVLNIIDDHSRVCVASQVFAIVKAPDVVRTIHKAAALWGYPQRVLTDNGLIFTTPLGGAMGAMESELMSLGIATRHSRPYHPQTCGKVERFHQTMKKYLAAQDPAETKKQLVGQLNRFARYYNTERPHRGLGRRTPITAFEAREKAGPIGPRIEAAGYRIRHDKVDRSGSVTLRHKGKLHHIGVGRPTRGGGSSCSSPASTSRSWAPTVRPYDTSRSIRAWTTSGCPEGTRRCLRCLETAVSDVSRHHTEAAPGFEPGYGALQAPA